MVVAVVNIDVVVVVVQSDVIARPGPPRSQRSPSVGVVLSADAVLHPPQVGGVMFSHLRRVL